MKPVSRGSVIAGSAAALTAIPAAGLCVGARSTGEQDPLHEGIKLHRQIIDAINALPDDIDAEVEAADAVLEDALSHPVISTVAAIAVLDIAVDEVELLAKSRYAQPVPTASPGNLQLPQDAGIETRWCTHPLSAALEGGNRPSGQ